MNQYIVRIIYKIEIPEKPASVQFEEKTYLIRSASPEAAYKLSKQIGYSNESAFVNKDGYQINWLMLGVSAFAEVEDNVPYFEFCSILQENYSDYQTLKINESIEQIKQQFENTLIE